MNYRAEIDGLRTIAVLAVIIYHAQFAFAGSVLFPGGFIGVDIFFVISGYLITRILLKELQTENSINIWHFYERRVRRIIPMLFALIIFCLPLAWAILLPTAFSEYCKSVFSALFFISNFYFAEVTTQYGAQDSLLMPFLHTWSLSIEEQFYIVFPLLLFMIFKCARRYLLSALIILFALSLATAEIYQVYDPDYNYYFPLSRFWELLGGSLLATLELKNKRVNNKLASAFLPAFGIIMMASAFFIFNDTETQHPAKITLLPIIGTMLFIYFSNGQDLTGKILSLKPVVFIGKISYSAYLWHFPLFAFARISNIELSAFDKINLIVITLLLSVLSYQLIEQPFRSKARISRKKLIGILSSALILIIITHAFIIYKSGLPERFPNIGLANYERDNEKLRLDSWKFVNLKNIEGFAKNKTKVFIIGNSHGKDLFNAFYQNPDIYSEFDFLAHITEISCFDKNNQDNYDSANLLYNSAEYKQSDVAIISARYMGGLCHRKRNDLQKSEDIDGLHFLIKQLLHDSKKVIVFSSSNEFSDKDSPQLSDQYLLELQKSGTDLTNIFKDKKAGLAFIKDVNQLYFEKRNTRPETNNRIQKIAKQYGVPYVEKDQYICDDSLKICYGLTPDGHKSFYDYSHYTLDGAKFFGQKMAEDTEIIELLNQ